MTEITEIPKPNESELRGLNFEVYDPESIPFEDVIDDVLAIEQSHFGEKGFTREDFESDFKNPEFTVVLLRDELRKSVLGYTYALPAEIAYNPGFHPDRKDDVAKLDGKAAYMGVTALRKDHIGKHLVGQMLEKLEEKLIEKGYTYLDRDTAVNNNYADNVEKNAKEKGRLVYAEPAPHESPFGPQRFLRMRLTNAKE